MKEMKNKELIKQLGDKGSIAIEALVKILTDESLRINYSDEATESLEKVVGRPVKDFMSSRGLVNHFGLWVTPEEKKRLLVEPRKPTKADTTAGVKSSQGTDWKISVLSARFESGALEESLIKNTAIYTPKEGCIFLLVEIEVENLNDSKRTAMDSDSLVIGDIGEIAYTPMGFIYPGTRMFTAVHGNIRKPPGFRVINNIYVYGIKKGATGLKLRALGAPEIVLDIKDCD